MIDRARGVHEYCSRCRRSTTTRLPARWARCLAVGLAFGALCAPLATPLLVLEPILAFVILLPFGIAVGPVVSIVKSAGVCAACGLGHQGLALRRLGWKVYLRGPGPRAEHAGPSALRTGERDPSPGPGSR